MINLIILTNTFELADLSKVNNEPFGGRRESYNSALSVLNYKSL
jgi:hypothetical protein